MKIIALVLIMCLLPVPVLGYGVDPAPVFNTWGGKDGYVHWCIEKVRKDIHDIPGEIADIFRKADEGDLVCIAIVSALFLRYGKFMPKEVPKLKPAAVPKPAEVIQLVKKRGRPRKQVAP